MQAHSWDQPVSEAYDGRTSLGGLLRRSARRDPQREALVFPDSRETYAELEARALDVARGLRGLGIRPGEHVGILMGNHPDLVATLFGVALAGAVVVPINSRYRTTELEYVTRDADLVTIVTHDAVDDYVNFAGLLATALPGLAEARDPERLRLPDHPSLRFVATLGRTHRPAGFVLRDRLLDAAAAVDPAEIDAIEDGLTADDVALIVYTSGTTSMPRGAMLSHGTFVGVWQTNGRAWRTTADDRHFTALPLFHVTALGCLTWVVAHGATFFSDRAVDAGRTLETIERERITQFYPAYPPVMEAVLNHPRFATTDLSSITTFLNVAPPEVLAKFQSRIPHAVQLTTYGSTEAGPVTLADLDDPAEVRIGTCGGPLPGHELRVCGPDGRVLGPGERGEIQLRGPNLLRGYYNHPEKDAEAFTDDGWFCTGDLGVLDDEGRLLFLGRLKEMLKVGGENVAPQEVEEQLCTHPAVRLAQVVGMPDQRLVEVVAAFVELVPGAQATEQELVDHVRGRIASFKVPRLIRFVTEDEWPMSATKIQRFRLRERLLAELEAGAERPAGSGAATPEPRPAREPVR